MEKMAISYAKYARYASGVAAPLGFRILTCHGEDLKDGISEGIGVSYPVFPLTILYGQRMRRPYFREGGKIKAIV